MRDRLRVVIADDERPARSLIAAMLRSYDDVELVAEADNGATAVELIEQHRPDLALLDLQMPELDGMGVVRTLDRAALPLVAFVTAYDEYAVRAFELNAIDYLLKPVDPARLRDTLNRAMDRLDRADLRDGLNENIRAAVDQYETATATPLRRIPVRKRDEIVFVAVEQLASIVADGELLHLTTLRNEKHTINHRLKDLEERLDTERFIRLSRGIIVNVETITRITPLPGGTYTVALANGQELQSSRFHSRVLRERLLRL